MEAIYYVGTYWKSNKKDHVVLQARKSVDGLNCELVDFFDARCTTKKQLKANKDLFLSFLKSEYPMRYEKCLYISID